MGLFKDSLKKWFYTNNSSAASNDARVPLLNADGTPKGSDTMVNLASVLGGFAKHDKNFGDSSLAAYKSSCSFIIFSSELNDSNKWTDIPQRVFSYVTVINFGAENCVQCVFNETTFFFRNYNNGNRLWSSWKKMTVVIM